MNDGEGRAERAVVMGREQPEEPVCWICGGSGTTGEHRTKRSDLRSIFGIVSQTDPIYLHDANRANQRISSLNSKLLKMPGPCSYCNNTRTQPHDRAWETLSAKLRTRTPPLGPGALVRTNRVFRYHTVHEMLNVHLFFIKLFGCYIAAAEIPLDIAGFAGAIMKGRAHPNVFLRFGCGRIFAGNARAGMSDMWLAPPKDGLSAFATWFYDVDGISINVMFAAEGERRQGLVGAWHPRHGTTLLTIASFPET